MNVLVLALSLLSLASPDGADEPPSLPDVSVFFGCPLAAPAGAFAPPASWKRVELGTVGVSIALPSGWKTTTGPRWARIEAPKRAVSLELRRSPLEAAGAGGEPERALRRLARSAEQRRLGPNHANRRCLAPIEALLAERVGSEVLRLGVYGRPMGWRRRSYALFAVLGDALLAVELKVRWGRRASGPDLSVVRRLFGGLRVASAGE